MASVGHPLRPVVLLAFDELLAQRGEPVILPQAIYEFYVVATRTVEANGLALSHETASAWIDGFLDEMTLIPDSEATFEAWRDLAERYCVSGNPNHDLRIVAAMVAAGIDGLLTFNAKHFRRFKEVTAIDPHDVSAGPDAESD